MTQPKPNTKGEQMENITIGNYVLMPQIGDNVARVFVQRRPNPHKVEPLYVYAYTGTPDHAKVTYKAVTGGATEIQAEFRDTWSAAFTDAMNHMEAVHNHRANAEAEKVAQGKRHADGLDTALAEFLQFAQRHEESES